MILSFSTCVIVDDRLELTWKKSKFERKANMWSKTIQFADWKRLTLTFWTCEIRKQ